MKLYVSAAVCASLVAPVGWAQAKPQADSQPSPMEAFAQQPGGHTAWSTEIARWEHGGTSAVIVGMVVEDASQPARRMRSVRIDLSSGDAHDQIYLDEEATARTRSALEEIADVVAKRGFPGANGRMGAREFWPLYNWPWNKYHELNADFCGGREGPTLVLTGRHKPGSFRFPGQTPTGLATILATRHGTTGAALAAPRCSTPASGPCGSWAASTYWRRRCW
jgi:hypothetical protein